jgi:AcrR family transcriptional regulator
MVQIFEPDSSMVYRRTDNVVRRLALRRDAILAAARAAAAEGGMTAVHIAPVAARAGIAAGTVYRYFPGKTELVAELVAAISARELAAMRRAAAAAPGPLSALAAAITTFAARALRARRLTWAMIGEPVEADIDAARQVYRRALARELETRIRAAAGDGHLPHQDPALAAAALVGALVEALVGPLAPDGMGEPGKLRETVQTLTLLCLRALGVVDARARGLVVQTALPPDEDA